MPHTIKTSKVFVVTTTNRTKWVDYIPVRQVVPGADKTNRYDQDGALPVTILGSVTGLREWVDYTPVVEVGASTNQWRAESDGYIPIIGV
jgi:hypothetical protein